MEIQISEVDFKGRPIFVIKNDENRVLLSIGMKKTGLILDNLDALKSFYNKNKNEE